MESQNYLGTRDAMVFCLDAVNGVMKGRLYHLYAAEAIDIGNDVELLKRMEELFDLIDYPTPNTSRRTFGRRGESHKPKTIPLAVSSEQQLLSRQGKMATFIFRIKRRVYSSWQGNITWKEIDRTVSFSSIKEMMMLLDEAISMARVPEVDESKPSWKTE